ncbi:MAG: DUF397 domain-containing protein [Candidatus Paceibacterota bacterium]|jgi:hypothetical protein
MNKGKFLNGCSFVTNEHGQKVDEDGFRTSSQTYITVRRTCVSVKINEDSVQIRDTKDSSKTTLKFNHAEWKAFIAGVKKGEFDLGS